MIENLVEVTFHKFKILNVALGVPTSSIKCLLILDLHSMIYLDVWI